jgi:hypothetical protein
VLRLKLHLFSSMDYVINQFKNNASPFIEFYRKNFMTLKKNNFKVVGHSLSLENIKKIHERAAKETRGNRSAWLDRHLTNYFNPPVGENHAQSSN